MVTFTGVACNVERTHLGVASTWFTDQDAEIREFEGGGTVIPRRTFLLNVSSLTVTRHSDRPLTSI